MNSLQPSLDRIEHAATVIHRHMPPTPQYRWPQLDAALGSQVWIKHENHTPVGAFKLRGGLVYFDELMSHGRPPAGVVSATRGNHGQSIALAAGLHRIPVTIVVPHGNSHEKNAAMQALGAELVEHGDDFQAARLHAQMLADHRRLLMAPSFAPALVRGVATWALELMRAVPDLDTIYVPIGLGSGICGTIAAREALGRRCEIVGVVSAAAPAYARSFAARTAVEAPVRPGLADGLACRVPEPDALAVILRHVTRVVEVQEDEIADAMRLLFSATHNVAEGAGAAGVAAMLHDRSRVVGKCVATVLCGGNVDRAVFARVLTGH